MKRFLTLTVALSLGFLSAFADGSFTVTPPSGAPVLVTPNRVTITSMQLLSTNTQIVRLFDANDTNPPGYGTNGVTAAYATRTSYPTNYVTFYIGNNGYTNWYTNAGLWTVTVTNAAATNALSPMLSAGVAANGTTTIAADALFVNGVVLDAEAAGVTVIINYK